VKNLIIIPVKNMQDVIISTLNQVKKSNLIHKSKILIIDNHSNDMTVQQIVTFFEKHQDINFELICNDSDLGYGGSIKLGLRRFKSDNLDWVLIIHSDDQTDWTKVLNHFDDAINESDLNIVVTSRFGNKSDLDRYSKLRKFGNYFFKFMTRLCTDLKISDPGVAIIAIRNSKLLDLNIDKLNDKYHFHPQLNLLIFHNETHYKEIFINWTNASKRENLNLMIYGIQLFTFLLKYGYFYKVKKFRNLEAISRSIK